MVVSHFTTDWWSSSFGFGASVGFVATADTSHFTTDWWSSSFGFGASVGFVATADLVTVVGAAETWTGDADLSVVIAVTSMCITNK